jgi:hypothetical protein
MESEGGIGEALSREQGGRGRLDSCVIRRETASSAMRRAAKRTCGISVEERSVLYTLVPSVSLFRVSCVRILVSPAGGSSRRNLWPDDVGIPVQTRTGMFFSLVSAEGGAGENASDEGKDANGCDGMSGSTGGSGVAASEALCRRSIQNPPRCNRRMDATGGATSGPHRHRTMTIAASFHFF